MCDPCALVSTGILQITNWGSTTIHIRVHDRQLTLASPATTEESPGNLHMAYPTASSSILLAILAGSDPTATRGGTSCASRATGGCNWSGKAEMHPPPSRPRKLLLLRLLYVRFAENHLRWHFRLRCSPVFLN